MSTLTQRITHAWRVLTNRYEGATFSPARSIIPGAVQSSRFDATSATRTELIRRIRYWEKNNFLVQRLADTFENHVVAGGLKFFSASTDTDWARTMDEWWQGFLPYADVSSRMSFDTLQTLAARAMFLDGDCFFILTHGADGRFPRVQLVEAHLCSTPTNLKDQENRGIVDGIALDDRGRPRGYYFVDEKASSRTEIVHRFIAAENVVHVVEFSRPGQYRGLTWFHAVLNPLHQLDDLMELELKACKDHSEISNIFETAGGGSDVADAIASGGSLPVVDANGKRTSYQEAVGGRTVYLDPGDKLTRWTSDRPHTNTVALWEVLENIVCDGVGIPRQIVRPSSIQGTVERALLSASAQWFAARSGVLAESFKQVWEYVALYGIRTQRTLSDPPGDWRSVTFRPPRSPNVDTGRNSAALLNELAAGIRTFSSVYNELGLDWRQELRAKADEVVYIKQLAAERGLRPEEISANTLPQPGASSSVAEQEDAEDEAPVIPDR